MKQFIKRNEVAGRRCRWASLRIFVAQILMLVLCVGPALSLDVVNKENVSNKAPAAPPKRGPLPSRRPKPIFAAPVQTTSLLAGQTVTLLGDGRALLIGGEADKHALDTVLLSDGFTGAPVPIKSKLRQARAWHSATTLPDGSVLVLGGIGKNGEVLKSAELFDPERQTFTLMPVPDIAAQAYHTATLLTDGQVLITGGTGATLLFDFKTKAFRALSGKPSATRQKHKATLLF